MTQMGRRRSWLGGAPHWPKCKGAPPPQASAHPRVACVSGEAEPQRPEAGLRSVSASPSCTRQCAGNAGRAGKPSSHESSRRLLGEKVGNVGGQTAWVHRRGVSSVNVPELVDQHRFKVPCHVRRRNGRPYRARNKPGRGGEGWETWQAPAVTHREGGQKTGPQQPRGTAP